MNWISVKEKPAPKDEPFLGYVLVGFHCQAIKDRRLKEIHTCIWDNFNERFKEYCNCSGNEMDKEYIQVTHWMPLPQPPS